MVAHVVDPPRLGQGGGRPAAMRRISATLVDSPDWRRLLALGPDEALDEPAVVQTIDGRWFRIQETRNVSGIAMIWVDISDRKRLEQDLMAAVAAEQQVRREQRQMLAMLSHEFRSPLTVIEATTQLLSVAGVDDLPRGLARIRRATQRLTSLIETCLADDRLEAGELRPKPAPFDLSSVPGGYRGRRRPGKGRPRCGLAARGAGDDDDRRCRADPHRGDESRRQCTEICGRPRADRDRGGRRRTGAS